MALLCAQTAIRYFARGNGSRLNRIAQKKKEKLLSRITVESSPVHKSVDFLSFILSIPPRQTLNLPFQAYSKYQENQEIEMDENKFTFWVHAPRKEDAIAFYMEAFGAVRKNDDQNGTVVLEICGRRYLLKEAGNDTRRCSPVLVCENPEILIAKACALGARIQDEIAEARMVTLGDQFGNVLYVIKKDEEIGLFWRWVWRAFTVINILCAGVGVLAVLLIL